MQKIYMVINMITQKPYIEAHSKKLLSHVKYMVILRSKQNPILPKTQIVQNAQVIIYQQQKNG